MNLPLIDFTNAWYVLAAVAIFTLYFILAYKNKSNTIPCVMLFVFLTILILHSVEFASNLVDDGVISKNIIFDELLILVSFISFLWLDKLQIEKMSKVKGKKKGSNKIDNKIIEKDGLDILWKKV